MYEKGRAADIDIRTIDDKFIKEICEDFGWNLPEYDDEDDEDENL